MRRWLARYVDERFPFGFWGPVAALLVVAAAPSNGDGAASNALLALSAFASCLVLLLLLRIVDDLLDRKKDAARFPDRLLVDPCNTRPALRWVCLLTFALALIANTRVFIAMGVLSLALVSLHHFKNYVPWLTVRGLLPQAKYPGVAFIFTLDGTALSSDASRAALVLVTIGASCYECATDELLRSRGWCEHAAGITIMAASVFLLHAAALEFAVRGGAMP